MIKGDLILLLIIFKMDKIVLIESILYTGEIPLAVGIKREPIHKLIRESYEKEIKNDPYVEEVLLPYEQEVDKVFRYVIEKLAVGSTGKRDGIFISPMESARGILHGAGMNSYKTRDMNLYNIQNGPEFTFLYIVFLDSALPDKLIIECPENKNLNKKWEHVIKENEWFLFPSSLEYYFTRGTGVRSIIKYKVGRY
jgi:hypothetical protein